VSELLHLIRNSKPSSIARLKTDLSRLCDQVQASTLMTSQTSTPLVLQQKATMPLMQEPQLEAKQDPTETAKRADRIRVKNRRKMYLDRHPEYFTSPDLELSGASNIGDGQKAD
jgi:hypothetical protein